MWSSSSELLEEPIRPVVTHFPASAAVWDATSLPLAVTLQPLANNDDNDDNAPSSLLSTIPKCVHCGAPHATRQTHFHPYKTGNSAVPTTFAQPAFLVCYLCGRVSSTTPEHQQAARPSEPLLGSQAAKAADSLKFASPTKTSKNGSIKSSTTTATTSSTFALPLRLMNESSRTPLYQVPALACPVLWFVVLDATATDATYWRHVHRLLSDSLAQAPPYVHFSLLLASPTDARLFQLDSPVPHLQHYNIVENASQQPFLLADAWWHSCVPLDSVHQAHVQTALRCLLDYAQCAYQPLPPSSTVQFTDDDDKESPKAGHSGMPLSWVLSTLSQVLLERGHAAGQRHDNDASEERLPYAGAQVSVLLHQPPQPPPVVSSSETEAETTAKERTPSRGVWGGRILLPEEEEEEASSRHCTQNDWSLSALEARYGPDAAEAIRYHADVGRHCTAACLTVDLLALDTTSSSGGDAEASSPWDYGLILLSGLTKSGGGSLGVYPVPAAAAALHAEWTSRLPWQTGRAFGAELRLRVSPGFGVDRAEPQHDDDDSPLAALYQQGGLCGPAVSSDHDHEEGLWRMASCDAFTTLNVDLQVTTPNAVPREFFVEAYGNVVIQPVLQTCLAYTTIEKRSSSNNKNGTQQHRDALEEYVVVRRLRIASRPMGPYVERTEALFNALDLPCLAVTLLHKLAVASLQDEGTAEMAPLAHEWLQALLVCAYQSAQAHYDWERRQSGRDGLLPTTTVAGSGDDPAASWFVPTERLLDCPGGLLSNTDVLLGKGHEHLQHVALLVYALLHNHALWPPTAVSLDDQWSALQHHHASLALRRSVQLWSCRDDDDDESTAQLLVEHVEGRFEAWRWAVQECQAHHHDSEQLYFVLESAHTVQVLPATAIFSEHDSDNYKSTTTDIPASLQSVVNAALSRHRVRPCLVVGGTTTTTTLQRLWCLEDWPFTATASDDGELAEESSCYSSFEAWRRAMAAQVEAQLDEDENNGAEAHV